MLLSELWPPRINSFLILRLWPFSNHEEKVLTPIFFSFRKICLLSPRALAMQYIFMATASYGGEATTLSFWVSECNNRIRTTFSFTTKSAEFYPIFLALGFCLFRNIFGRSTISDNFFELLRILHEIFFSVLLIVCLVMYYRRPQTSRNHFRRAPEQNRLYLAEMS